MHATDVFGTRSIRNHQIEIWLSAFYYITFIMSTFGVPLLIHGFATPLGGTTWDTVIVVSTEIALIGAIYYPFAAIARYMRGRHLNESEWFCAFGAASIAIVFAVTLARFDTQRKLIYAVFPIAMVGAPLFALLITRLQYRVAR